MRHRECNFFSFQYRNRQGTRGRVIFNLEITSTEMIRRSDKREMISKWLKNGEKIRETHSQKKQNRETTETQGKQKARRKKARKQDE